MTDTRRGRRRSEPRRDAGELHQHPIAGVLHNSSAMFPDLGVYQLPEMRPEAFVRAFLVRPISRE